MKAETTATGNQEAREVWWEGTTLVLVADRTYRFELGGLTSFFKKGIGGDAYGRGELSERTGIIEDGVCPLCGEQTNSFAADPSKWPLRFCPPGAHGVTQPHHVGCVTERVYRGSNERAVSEKEDDCLMEATLRRGLERDSGHRTRSGDKRGK